jgi:hypothetical protein
MKHLTLTVSDIVHLKSIQNRLVKYKAISKSEKFYLAKILAQIPNVETLLIDKVPINGIFNVISIDQQEKNLQCWLALLNIGPGWDYAPFCYLVVEEDTVMLNKNVIMITQFAPSMSRNLDSSKRGFELWFKDNGDAVFWLPTLEDAEQYHNLYSFKGSWNEAYYLLIETWKIGWPMEEFPEELRQFLIK